MRFEREGEWIVSTPIYVGSSADVAKATKCSNEYEESNRERKLDGNRPIEIVLERCKKCVATRAKYRDVAG